MVDCLIGGKLLNNCMKHVVISIGHNPKSPGAVGLGRIEHFEAAIIASYLNQYLIEMGIKVTMVPTGTLRQKVNYVNLLKDVDVAIEVHLNASSNKSVRGSETLYFPLSKKGKKLAKAIESYMKTITHSRGSKEGWYRGVRNGKYLYFLAKTKPVSVIVEPYFITSEYIEPQKVAYKIALGIKKYLDTEH